MSIYLKELRIRNFKCFETLDIELKANLLLLGANNVGKTTLLEALELSLLTYKNVSKEMIFLNKNEILDNNKIAIIDILIEPEEKEFSDEWYDHFGAFVIEGEEKDGVGIRTILKYNDLKGEYELEKKAMNQWPKSDEVEQFIDYNKHPIRKELLDAIPVFYLDAKRDILTDMNNQYSYWGKLTGNIELAKEHVDDIEKSLKEIGQNIIDNSDILGYVTQKLNNVSKIMGTNNRSVEINPITQKIRDINKGMQIRISDEFSESFSIDNLGMGTRSWTTFLTLAAYIDLKEKEMKSKQKPFFPVLLLEEPESHLHPQAQRKIYQQMKDLKGQKFISTHSPIVAAQVQLEEILHVHKNGSSSRVSSINLDNLSQNEIRKIKEEVVKSRGDLLYANKVILCEGETEEQVLPVFYKHYFGHECFEAGINVIGVNGSGKYKPFLQISRDLGIEVFILSDGEEETIQEISKFYKQIFGEIGESLKDKNVVFLPNGADFENYLVNEGYKDELLDVIDNIEGKENFIETYIKRKHKTKGGRVETEEVCQKCKQHIYKNKIRDYSGEHGINSAIVDILHKKKTEYSAIIAHKIIERQDTTSIPLAIRDLFDRMNIKEETNEFNS
ncbi:ATP-dependent nuclease [Macrococcus equipercicus]|uniref:AAA family ATPase n=1 Tax=Macrococcus equipercicus TaxID=69967 RepID=A0A9Q9BQZ4_9STAP|nr:AAA family ATPase [Macrococcus equipercicus]UTH14071.1 AAA family ATPase [Macrococcus equipercicus]